MSEKTAGGGSGGDKVSPRILNGDEGRTEGERCEGQGTRPAAVVAALLHVLPSLAAGREALGRPGLTSLARDLGALEPAWQEVGRAPDGALDARDRLGVVDQEPGVGLRDRGRLSRGVGWLAAVGHAARRWRRGSPRVGRRRGDGRYQGGDGRERHGCCERGELCLSYAEGGGSGSGRPEMVAVGGGATTGSDAPDAADDVLQPPIPTTSRRPPWPGMASAQILRRGLSREVLVRAPSMLSSASPPTRRLAVAPARRAFACTTCPRLASPTDQLRVSEPSPGMHTSPTPRSPEPSSRSLELDHARLVDLVRPVLAALPPATAARLEPLATAVILRPSSDDDDAGEAEEACAVVWQKHQVGHQAVISWADGAELAALGPAKAESFELVFNSRVRDGSLAFAVRPPLRIDTLLPLPAAQDRKRRH